MEKNKATETFHLRTWSVNIINESMYSYEYICDGMSLIILDPDEDYLTFIKERLDGTLQLNHISYNLRYIINEAEPAITITIL